MSRLRRNAIFAGCLFTGAVFTFQYKLKECIEVVGNPASVGQPKAIFWLRVVWGRARSRWAGSIADMRLPTKLRAPMFRMFAAVTNADLEEVRYPLDSYQTFGDFFARALKDGARPVADVPLGVVSPVDAVVQSMGSIDGPGSRIEQVKGSTFSVAAFLGIDPTETSASESTLQYVVLYLSPGMYHRIHAPSQVTFTQGRHFCGELLPVRANILRLVDDIFAINERVVLSGSWKYGQIHLTAVGAANVGNIWLDFDDKLRTNKMRDIPVYLGGDIASRKFPREVNLSPGDLVGGFRLGSSVVLIIDTPKNFRWSKQPGETIKMGEAAWPSVRVALPSSVLDQAPSACT
eukprot:CAMPEP_0178419826 /NCGR_PEP_ID=MMETSP0689_2-20121128/25812_1 /TAXON_ID=160604 /ORGANISM="Amphidinium massartii, Strain CS-259" /LENGTH=347 /DNA_ID=CAMNT_0020041279 /DNA_START=1 /DNA_END=1039 /DNA_ORIENTATION=+